MAMINFIGQSYTHRSSDVSCQRSVNLYPEIIEDESAKSKYILIGTPGTKLYLDLSDITNGDCRGMHTVAAKRDPNAPITSRTFAVYGDKLIEIVSKTEAINLFTISAGSTRISFCDTGTYLVFCDGRNMYGMNLETGVVSEITLPFGYPTMVMYSNGRVIAINTDSEIDVVRNYNKFYWSELNDPLTWDALSWANAEGTADPITSFDKRQGEIWLFGPRSFEVWRGTSNPDNPFSRAGGSFGDVGCGAINSVTSIIEQVFWLGSSKAGKNQIFMSNGYNAQRISTHAIEKAMSDAGATTTDAIGFTYQQEGHIFYVLTLVQADQTWVYDLTTNQWHERSTRDPRLNIQHRWSPLFATFGNDTVLVGNSTGPQVLELSLEQYWDWNVDAVNNTIPLVRLRQTPIYWDELRLMFHREFYIDIETGVGVQTETQGNDPQIMLQFSDDGGHSWSSEMWTSLGKIGAYNARARWRRLGRSRERVYRVVISDPVKVVMIGARIIAEKGMNP